MIATGKTAKKRTRSRARKLALGKPRGAFLDRVKNAGPEKFGIVAIDCAKARSKWMLADFYGRVLIEPTEVTHSRNGLQLAVMQLKEAVKKHDLRDVIVAVEMTGVYHKPSMRAFRDAGFETRLVHPFASASYRRPEFGDIKTDDNDLGAIFRAAANGFGLVENPLPPVYQRLQILVRHRRDLTYKKSKLQCQIRHQMDLCLPGFAALFSKKDLWTQQAPLPLLRAILTTGATASVVRQAGRNGIIQWLRAAKIRLHEKTIARVLVWSADSVPADESAAARVPVLLSLLDDWHRKTQEILQCERDLIGDLVNTPYVLLMSYPGISVVTAAEIASEAGPIENYASAKAISGRAGLFPSRYQSDEVDCGGKLTRFQNPRLRHALLLMADNLLKCNTWWMAVADKWRLAGHTKQADLHVRVANRMTRSVFQIVAGRRICRHRSQREPGYLLDKLLEYCRALAMSPAIIVTYLKHASDQMRQDDRKLEAENLKPVALQAQRSRRQEPQHMGTLLVALLAQLGIAANDEKQNNPG